MWLIAGLGNPGIKYQRTRHNLGFMAVDLLAEKLKCVFVQSSDSLIARARLDSHTLLLCKPLTFMNLSGQAISRIMLLEDISPERLIVLHDDLDLQLGRIKIKKGSSSGGHRGVQSVIDSIQRNDFVRIKMGIGRPEGGTSVTDFVLQEFAESETPVVQEMIERASEAAVTVVSRGLQQAMSIYNQN